MSDSSAVTALTRGIQSIEQFGWYKGDFGDGPRGWVRASDDVSRGQCQCLATAVMFDEDALDYVRKVLGLPMDRASTEPIFEANDSQPATEEGRQWALDVLRQALALAEEQQ